MLPNDLLTPTGDDFDRFEERLLRTIDTQQRHRRRRHRAVLGTAAVLLVAGGGTTAWVTLATPELRTQSAYCYAEANTDSAFTQVGSPSDQIAPDGTVATLAPVVDPAAAAVSNCAAVWAIDLFGTGPDAGFTPLSDPGDPAGTAEPSEPSAVPSGRRPDLQACLRPDGVYAVFPVPGTELTAADADAFCAALGLQPPYQP